MSANTTPVQVTEKKARKAALSAKYSKFMVFGYNLMQSLRASDILNDEGLESAYAQLKLFDNVDNQTEFYEQVLNQTKETGKTMRKFITQRNKPPKAARKPRAKKEAAPVSEAVTTETASATTEKKEKKTRKPRAKKTTEVVQDTQNDVVGEIIAAANADPLEGISNAPVVTEEKPKKTRKPRAKKETTTEVAPPKSPEKKDIAEVKTPDAPKKKGRKPKKTETVVENTPPAVVEATVQEELEEEEITTQEIVIKGTTYLIDDENNLYSVQTHEEVGSYNPETEEITLNQ
jgi:hypothetical protein